MIQREIEQQVKSLFQKGKVILIMGARQVGISTLLSQLFYDLGVRNALIGNFTPIKSRMHVDTSALWENFAIAERIKRNSYCEYYCQSYFWRTQQQEIDYVEEKNGQLRALEFKWNENKVIKCPTAFATAYPETEFQVISPKNIETFILEKCN